jgi:peptidoglycan/xylan/chitin deacetylase (PgdA/CDA1 family)
LAQVAITFDDLPFVTSTADDAASMQQWMKQLIAALTAAHIPAVGFVNEQKLYRQGQLDPSRTALLRDWLDAGLELGNHTFSHQSLNRVSVEAFKSDVIRGELVTKALLKEREQTLRYFRYPFNDLGLDQQTRDSVREFLIQSGYSIAPITISNADWVFAKAYDVARENSDVAIMHRIVTAYLEHIGAAFNYAEDLTIDLFGSNIRQILVLHANKLNADCLSELINMISDRGYVFVSLQQALDHSAYQTPDSYTGSGGKSWLQRWAMTAGLRPGEGPPVPLFVRQLAGTSVYRR